VVTRCAVSYSHLPLLAEILSQADISSDWLGYRCEQVDAFKSGLRTTYVRVSPRSSFWVRELRTDRTTLDAPAGHLPHLPYLDGETTYSTALTDGSDDRAVRPRAGRGLGRIARLERSTRVSLEIVS
jgi:hypothetical protein